MPELWPEIRTGRAVRAARPLPSGSKTRGLGLAAYQEIPPGTPGRIRSIFRTGDSVGFCPCFRVRWDLPGDPQSTCFADTDVKLI